eukprot:TRINITY_DN11104_c0_g1_i1.p1 TRINITY_DN11104_c0_g1~~TRINITY_DN11104_c0_g1_i1.p1  ORF type:complete len:601 (+),score=118.55 TRINITY_DN11104_c0_g1_i1:65-1804(+)
MVENEDSESMRRRKDGSQSPNNDDNTEKTEKHDSKNEKQNSKVDLTELKKLHPYLFEDSNIHNSKKQFHIDEQGLPVYTNNPAVLPYISKYYTQVLSYGSSWSIILPTLRLDPSCHMSIILASDYYLASQLPHLTFALLSFALSLPAPPTSSREAFYLSAYHSWFVVHNVPLAIFNFREVLKRFPGDLFALKRAQLLAFMQGDAKLMLELSEMVRPSNENSKWYWGMEAFALEQNGKIEEAEAAAKKGVELEEGDVWAMHAMGHVGYYRGGAKGREVEKWMRDRCKMWEDRMSFIYTHNWFHIGLFLLDQQDWFQTLHVFDHNIWLNSNSSPNHPLLNQISNSNNSSKKEETTDNGADDNSGKWNNMDKSNTQDQINAIEVLFKTQLRLNLCNFVEKNDKSVKRWNDMILDRFTDVGTYVEKNIIQETHSIHDLLYVLLSMIVFLVLKREKEYNLLVEKVTKSLDQQQKKSEKEVEKEQRKSKKDDPREVFMKLVHACKCWTREDWRGVVENCRGIIPDGIGVIGGSREQREVFSEVFIEGLVKSQDKDAGAFITQRLEERGGAPQVLVHLLNTIQKQN